MNPSDRLADAIDSAVAAVAANANASVVVRAALRVATLRQDALAEYWLSQELLGIGTKEENEARHSQLLSRLTGLVGAEEAERSRALVLKSFMDRRSLKRDGSDSFASQAVAGLEAQTIAMKQLHDDPVTPGMTPLDTGLAALDRQRAKAQLAPALVQQATILERIKDAAYSYVLEAEAASLAGDALPESVAKGRAFVEVGLARHAPLALDCLRAAEAAAAIESQESASHAATSCRRAIKILADALYPSGAPVTDDLGVVRELDDEHYRNRLIQYIRSLRGRSNYANLLASNLASLGTRLKSLDDLASKGVHADLSRAEVESCVTWVYMLAADLLRVTEEADS